MAQCSESMHGVHVCFEDIKYKRYLISSKHAINDTFFMLIFIQIKLYSAYARNGAPGYHPGVLFFLYKLFYHHVNWLSPQYIVFMSKYESLPFLSPLFSTKGLIHN